MEADLLSAVPHLTTALTGPLQTLEKLFLEEQARIENWLRNQWRNTPPPLYSSVDLRNAGFKLAPVDTNLFAAGFNNLNPEFMPLCIQAMQATIDKYHTGCSRILLIPENHTRNAFYLESLATLRDILLRAGFDVRIGSLREDLIAAQDVPIANDRHIHFEPVVRHGNRLGVEGFDPCIIILNNDLSGHVPDILQNVAQPITPPTTLGWTHRLKSDHFRHYQAVTQEFAELLDIDPWLITPLFRQSTNVNFLNREGDELLEHQTAELLKDIEQKYRAYNIQDKPFVIVKADAGTYGMGVMTIRDPAELRELNRRERSSMTASKGKQIINKVILQEGVYTYETIGEQQAVAEPVIYMIGSYVVGGFYRVHQHRGSDENLNAPGMHFVPLAFAQPCNNPQFHLPPNDCYNRFYAYGVIARLALAAAAREKQAVEK